MVKQGVKQRVLVPAALALFVLLAGFIGGAWWLQSRYTAAGFDGRISASQQLLREALHADLSTLGATATVLSRNEPLLELWQRGNREALLQYASPLAEELRVKYAITHFYFQTLDCKSFLRVHNPSRFGDTIARYTLRHTAETGKPTSGIEMGAMGMFTLRLVQPCSLRGVPIGYLELGIDVKHLSSQMRKVVNVDTVFLIDKRYLDRAGWVSGMQRDGRSTDWDLLPNMAVVDSTFQVVPPVLLAALRDRVLTPEHSGLEMTVRGDSSLTAMLPLVDAGGKGIGWMVVCNDISADKSRLLHTVLFLSALGLLLAAVKLGLAWVYLGRVERQLDAFHKRAIAESTAHEAAQKRHIGEIQIERDALQAKTAALAEASLAAQAATKAKSEFLANMSHEIRTPMTAILGFTDTLLHDELSPREHRVAVETVRRNGEHLLQLINDVLDLSKIEAGKLTVDFIACSPARVLAEAAALVHGRAAAKGLEFRIEHEGPLPAMIRCDPTRLRQVLVNLVGNAVKFTDRGSVRMVLRCVRDGDTAVCQWEVIDTGMGIQSEFLQHIFEPFTQADESVTRRFGGSGLGLAISHRMAEALGGDIRVASQLGQGSTFRLNLPVGQFDRLTFDDSPPEDLALDADGSPVAHPAGTPRLRGRILLAEDGPDTQRLLVFFLHKAGAQVTLANNGRVAYDEARAALARGDPFDVILMDMQMPVMDGYEATRRLRAEGYTGSIVALTAHAMAGDDAKCLAAGCDAYLTKPIDRQKLLATVAHWAARSPTNDHSPQPATSENNARTPTSTAFLYSHLAADPDLGELVEIFVQEMPDRIKALEKQAQSRDWEQLTRTAHQLKGAAGSYGFHSLTPSAARLEIAARDGRQEQQILSSLDELLDFCRRVRSGVPATEEEPRTPEGKR